MLCPSPLTLTSVSLRSTLVTVCQVTMQPVCGGMPRFKESAPQKLSLFTLPLRHATLCQGPRHHRHLASLRQHFTRSQRENLPSCANCSQSLLKTVHPEVINTYISHTIFSSRCSKCLSEPGKCIAATLRAQCGSFLFTCEETQTFSHLLFKMITHKLREKSQSL